jgi:hypothetical protein
MSDADLVRDVLTRLTALSRANHDFGNADVAEVLIRRRTVDGALGELLECDFVALDALAVQLLHTQPGEWGVKFVEELKGLMPGAYGTPALEERLRRWEQTLDTLARLVACDGPTRERPKDDETTLPSAESIRPPLTFVSAAQLAQMCEVNEDTMGSALRRHYAKRPDCRERNSKPKKGEPLFLYRLDAVQDVVEKYKKAPVIPTVQKKD